MCVLCVCVRAHALYFCTYWLFLPCDLEDRTSLFLSPSLSNINQLPHHSELHVSLSNTVQGFWEKESCMSS